MNTTPRNHRHGTPQTLTAATTTATATSPFARNATPNGARSPIKTSSKERHELGLSLKQVIGTTCQSVNAFDHLPLTGSFAFTAGAAAVVATVDKDRNISQRFFRANPVQSSSRTTYPTGLARESYTSPDPRHRTPLPKEHERPDWNDSPTGNRGGSIRERVKAATAVGFSPNGRFLVVGETGYKPRVLIFSLAEKASVESPTSVICEHSFGIQAVSFSPDSKYIASLGTINDGFLFIWSIDERTCVASLAASNRCTNVIRQMAWMGSSLVTVGLRFIKIWRPNDLPASVNENSEKGYGLYNRQHKPLAGRNALLGDLLEATFTCVVAVSDTEAIICTEGGDICILDDSERNQRLTRVLNVDFSITAACLGPSSEIIITGLDSSIRVLDLNELKKTNVPPGEAPGSCTRCSTSSHFVAVGSVGEDAIVTIDNRHGIQLRPVVSKDEKDDSDRAMQRLPAHSDAVLGVRALCYSNNRDIAFMTWSANGTIILWSAACHAKATIRVPINQSVDMYNVVNELKTVVTFSNVSHVLTGDKHGVLTVSKVDTGECVLTVRAHSAEITDITVREDSKHTLVATSSRDRTMQLFTWDDERLQLLQTLEEHAGSVTCVLFAKDKNQLLSCSADRTIVVREAVDRGDGGPPIYIMLRTITLKSSPTCMRTSLFDDTILVSATDRSIQLVGIRTGRVALSFKANDPEGGDAVIMSSLVHLPSTTGVPIIAGVASSDKSVRLYAEDGTLLARDWGHSEGVTDIALLRSHEAPDDMSAMRLVTVAADGTIFIWATVPERPRSRDSDSGGLQAPSYASSAPGIKSVEQPLRKVISQSEIARLQRSKSADVENADPPPSPTSGREAKGTAGLKKKSSRLNIRPLRLEPSPLGTLRNGATAKHRQRSPSPPSPQPATSPRPPRSSHGKHRLSVGGGLPIISSPTTDKASKDGTKPDSGFGSLSASTEQLSRMLRAYRQKLDASLTGVSSERLKELERELDSTARVVQRMLGTGGDAPAAEKTPSETSVEGGSAEMGDISKCASPQGVSFASA